VAAEPVPSVDARVKGGTRMFSGWLPRTLTIVVFLALVLAPLNVGSPFLLTLLTTTGISAIGAIGLNVVTGHAGLVSLGHSFYIGIGAYAAVGLGSKMGLPLIVWLLGAIVAGAIAGALTGPFAARLRGIYLLVLTLGLVYIGVYLFTNWRSLSGGPAGTSAEPGLSLGFLDFNALRVGNVQYSRTQGLCVLIWLLVAAAMIFVKNVTRTRFGRAMRAMHDSHIAAETIGVNLLRTKTGALAIGGALGGLAGALYVAQVTYVSPSNFDINMAVQYVVIIIVGGTATSYGPVVGAAIVSAVPLLITQYAAHLPFIETSLSGGAAGLSAGAFSQIVYGVILIAFLVAEPRGCVSLIARAGRSAAALVRGRRGEVGGPPTRDERAAEVLTVEGEEDKPRPSLT